MPRLTRLLVTAGLFAAAFAALGLIWLDPTPVPAFARRGLIPGAYQALTFWTDQRAYPAPDLPAEGLAQALAQRQALAARGGEPASVWQSMGPHNQGGRTLALALNPLRPTTLWVGSAGGGLWRATLPTGGGVSWTRVETGFAVHAASAIAIAPSDTSVMYLGTGEVYKYQDIQGGTVSRPTRGAYGIGILKSTDGGQTWSHVLNWTRDQRRGVQMIRVNPTNPNDVWAATTEGVYRSTDGGATWANVHPVVMATDLLLHPTDPNWALAAHGNQSSPGKGLYRTTDGGATWTQLTAGVPTTFIGKILLDRHPTDLNTLYASVGNGISGSTSTWLLRTTDGGDTWTTVTTADYASYQGWFAHYVAVNPHRPNEVWLGGVDLWRSLSGGASPTPIGNIHPDHHHFAFHPTNPDIVYFAGDGGLYRTTNGGASFEDLNAGYQTLQLYNGTSHAWTDSTRSLGGAQDNGVRAFRGTLDWAHVIGGDGTWTAIDPVNPQYQYGAWQNLNLQRSMDGGFTFAPIVPPTGSATAFVAPFALAPTMPQRLYAGRAIIYRSDNRGSSGTWRTTNGGVALDGNPALALTVAPSDSNTVYVSTAPITTGASRTRLWKTVNAGASWTQVTGTLPDRYLMDVAIHPTNPAIAYVVASGWGAGHVFKTTDGGASWTDVTGVLPDAPTTAVVIDPLRPNDVYVGNDVGVFVSRDGGASWGTFSNGLPGVTLTSDLQISPSDRTLRVATHGHGMYKRALDGDPTANEPPAPAAAVALETVAPNPVRDRATVTFRLDRPAHVRLALYDARGRAVAVVLDRAMAAGRHTVPVEAARLAGGTYVVRLMADGRALARPMTVVR
ncbi:MAG TPA: hypothetical protein VD962_04565 [Rubricoccaceae bacterium]|nr:hypothetical protein [Rubricoccaceae bacterium]